MLAYIAKPTQILPRLSKLELEKVAGFAELLLCESPRLKEFKLVELVAQEAFLFGSAIVFVDFEDGLDLLEVLDFFLDLEL